MTAEEQTTNHGEEQTTNHGEEPSQSHENATTSHPDPVKEVLVTKPSRKRGRPKKTLTSPETDENQNASNEENR